LVKHLVDYVVDEWNKEDNGIWEFRLLKKHFTFSKLMCWVALDRAIEIARYYRKDENISKWSNMRDKIKEDILTKAWNEKKQAFTMYYGSDDLDASILLMSYYKFLDANDDRLRKTIEAIEKDLMHDPLVFRYKMIDEFGKPTSAFSICTFWLIDALYFIGQKSKAKKIFKRMINHSNHLGLFSEDIDLKTKELTGNFPQGYTHLALMFAAILLSGKGTRRPVCKIHI